MSLNAFNSGCNVLAYDRRGRKMAMCCAWAMQYSYSDLLMLLGSQSDTGNCLGVGDMVGVSSLSKGQGNIALQLGTGHSLTSDKFSGIQYTNDHGVILIDGAKVRMRCEVTRIDCLDGDHLVYLRVDGYEDDPTKEFLGYGELGL